MNVKGMTQRWMLNSMALILFVIIALEICAAFLVHGYYVNSVRQGISSRAGILTDLFSRYANTSIGEYEIGARDFVEGLTDKDKMEVQIFNRYGKMVISSSGFLPEKEQTYLDYNAAVASADGRGEWSGKQEGGESVMAMTRTLSSADGSFAGAVRYVVSMTEVNRQIYLMLLFCLLGGLAIVFFVVLSSTYFINSIIIPIKEVSSTARKVAGGDFNTRIDKKYDDEIGDLCDTINYMAGELAAGEKIKNDFISSVSHELRTPLTAIKGWGETLLAGKVDGTTFHKGMSVIVKESERLSLIVEELLDFSRMQSGRMTMRMERMDVLAELMEAAFMYKEKAKREGIELIFNEPEELPYIMGDKNRIKQVFVNIIDNAIKYSDSGGTVRIEAFVRDGMVCIVVADTGIGISKNEVAHVKEKFYKAKSNRRGSGIGLAVADEIIHMHGGTLDIGSEENVGTVVGISLPAAKKETAPEPVKLPEPPEERNQDHEQ